MKHCQRMKLYLDTWAKKIMYPEVQLSIQQHQLQGELEMKLLIGMKLTLKANFQSLMWLEVSRHLTTRTSNRNKELLHGGRNL